MWRHRNWLDLERGWNGLDFSSDVEIYLIFEWGIEFDLVLVLGSKVTFFLRGIEIDLVRVEIIIFYAWWSMVFGWVVVVEIDLVFGCGPQIAWFLSGWSILTWSQCGGRTWLDFSLGIGIIFFGPGGRKRLGFSIWIGIDLSFVWWCSTANRYRVLTDRYAGYVLEICWLCSRRPPSHRWLSRSALILCKRTKEVRASNFSQGWLSSSVVYPA